MDQDNNDDVVLSVIEKVIDVIETNEKLVNETVESNKYELEEQNEKLIFSLTNHDDELEVVGDDNENVEIEFELPFMTEDAEYVLSEEETNIIADTTTISKS